MEKSDLPIRGILQMDQPIFAKFIWLGIFGEIDHFRYIKIQLGSEA